MPGLNGLVVMKPTSIASTGTGNSSSIGANGKVTFSSCATLSLNGVFTSSYDNYMVSVRYLSSSTATGMVARLRVSGTDATGSNYTVQAIYLDGTSLTAARGSNQTYFDWSQAYGTQRCGSNIYLFGPALSQPTAIRSVNVSDLSSAYFSDWAVTHSLSTAYDGVTLYPGAGTFTGLVTVYGFNQ